MSQCVCIQPCCSLLQCVTAYCCHNHSSSHRQVGGIVCCMCVCECVSTCVFVCVCIYVLVRRDCGGGVRNCKWSGRTGLGSKPTSKSSHPQKRWAIFLLHCLSQKRFRKYKDKAFQKWLSTETLTKYCSFLCRGLRGLVPSHYFGYGS